MDLKDKLRGAIRNFYSDTELKIKHKILEAYTCEMKCYEGAHDIEKADQCAAECRSMQTPIREKLSEFPKFMEELSSSLDTCGKNEKCADKAISKFKSSLENLVSSFSNT
ncbi:hypothetical protein SteCoe_9255 [Stentor coeruleus]|uniref:Uncharacterized protein n=1 Tax=Stentor coeruleus TaxID=5963 RepID=A0A1R2CI90_9CILI|nr:hypothetical protein SteCoe_9255 [Stentor coeruleus]